MACHMLSVGTKAGSLKEIFVAFVTSWVLDSRRYQHFIQGQMGSLRGTIANLQQVFVSSWHCVAEPSGSKYFQMLSWRLGYSPLPRQNLAPSNSSTNSLQLSLSHFNFKLQVWKNVPLQQNFKIPRRPNNKLKG